MAAAAAAAAPAAAGATSSSSQNWISSRISEGTFRPPRNVLLQLILRHFWREIGWCFAVSSGFRKGCLAFVFLLLAAAAAAVTSSQQQLLVSSFRGLLIAAAAAAAATSSTSSSSSRSSSHQQQPSKFDSSRISEGTFRPPRSVLLRLILHHFWHEIRWCFAVSSGFRKGCLAVAFLLLAAAAAAVTSSQQQLLVSSFRGLLIAAAAAAAATSSTSSSSSRSSSHQQQPSKFDSSRISEGTFRPPRNVLLQLILRHFWREIGWCFAVSSGFRKGCLAFVFLLLAAAAAAVTSSQQQLLVSSFRGLLIAAAAAAAATSSTSSSSSRSSSHQQQPSKFDSSRISEGTFRPPRSVLLRLILHHFWHEIRWCFAVSSGFRKGCLAVAFLLLAAAAAAVTSSQQQLLVSSFRGLLIAAAAAAAATSSTSSSSSRSSSHQQQPSKFDSSRISEGTFRPPRSVLLRLILRHFCHEIRWCFAVSSGFQKACLAVAFLLSTMVDGSSSRSSSSHQQQQHQQQQEQQPPAAAVKI